MVSPGDGLSPHYRQLSAHALQNDKFAAALSERYSQLSNDFLTREVRFIIERCLSAGDYEFITRLNSDGSENSHLTAYLQLDGWMDTLLKKFRSEMERFFQAESQVLGQITDGESDVRLAEIQDRHHRLIEKFDWLYCRDNGLSFLCLLKSMLDVERCLMTSPSDEIDRLSRKRRFDSDSKACLQGSKLERRTASLSDTSETAAEQGSAQLRETLAKLKTFCLTEIHASRQIQWLLDLCINWLSLERRVTACNDLIACQDLASLDAQLKLAQVLRSCTEIFPNLKGRLESALDQLRRCSLVMTRQSDQVIRTGSRGSKGKYVILNVRLLFADFFAKSVTKEEYKPMLHVAVINALETARFSSEQLTREELCASEELTNDLLDGRCETKWEDNGSSSSLCASLKLRFKTRPETCQSASGAKGAQAFALCVFFQHGDTGFVACLSKPVAFITNDNQRAETTATVEYFGSLNPIYPLKPGPPASISVDQAVDLIAAFVLKETKRKLNSDSIAFFYEKCRALKSPQDSLVPFCDFVAKPTIGVTKGGGRSVWEFVHSCVKFARDRATPLFRDGFVYGFITREQANGVLARMTAENPSLALLRFTETYATVSVSTLKRHDVPKPDSHFNSVTLAEACYSSLPASSKLLTADGTFASAEELTRYIPKSGTIAGYVSLCREFSICGDLDSLNIDVDFDELLSA